MANRTANALRALGVWAGDRVAIQLPNVPAFVWSYLGTLKIGAIAVSLSPSLTPEELAFLLHDCGARVLITGESDVVPLHGADDGRVESTRVLVADGEPRRGSLDVLLAAAAPNAVAIPQEPAAPAAIVYTSGTTGSPRGATLSHANVLFAMESKQRYLDIRPDDRLLLFLPLFHCFGQNAVLNAGLHAGATIVLQRGFEAAAVIRSLRADAVTMFFGVPTNYVVLLDMAGPGDFASVRYFFSAAAPLPREVEARWTARFGAPIYQGYGATETSPFAGYNHVTAHRPGSIGVAIDGVEMGVVDVKDGHPLGAGETGEIVVRGPNVMLGYWNRPEDTAAVVRDGWFHTGDLGHRDQDGYFFLDDRLKDMAIVGGQNVYPAEVENALYQHPAVREVAVHGVPDPVLGERLRAVVVKHDGTPVGAAALIAFCRSRLAPVKVPAEVTFVEALPRNRSGKVLKRVLRDTYVPSGPGAGVVNDLCELTDRMARWLAERLDTDAGGIELDRPFADYGVTSALGVELAVEVTRWTSRVLPHTAPWSFPTIAALAAAALAPPAAGEQPRREDDDVEPPADAALDALSDREIDRLLLHELENVDRIDRV